MQARHVRWGERHHFAEWHQDYKDWSHGFFGGEISVHKPIGAVALWLALAFATKQLSSGAVTAFAAGVQPRSLFPGGSQQCRSWMGLPKHQSTWDMQSFQQDTRVCCHML